MYRGQNTSMRRIVQALMSHSRCDSVVTSSSMKRPSVEMRSTKPSVTPGETPGTKEAIGRFWLAFVNKYTALRTILFGSEVEYCWEVRCRRGGGGGGVASDLLKGSEEYRGEEVLEVACDGGKPAEASESGLVRPLTDGGGVLNAEDEASECCFLCEGACRGAVLCDLGGSDG